MVHTLKLYCAVLVIFLAIDFLWLGVIMSKFYKDELGTLARKSGDSLTPVVWAAGLVYLLIPLGIVLFVLPRVSPDSIVPTAIFWGFIYGIILYGVYDMTNYSLLENWTLRMTVVDIIWGGTLNALMTCIAAFLNRWLS